VVTRFEWTGTHIDMLRLMMQLGVFPHQKHHRRDLKCTWTSLVTQKLQSAVRRCDLANHGCILGGGHPRIDSGGFN
jgi:hypothetical protein